MFNSIGMQISKIFNKITNLDLSRTFLSPANKE